ncbi:MAG: hypothetical protein GWM87_14545 [Xanthomonadales bacterium]|nr:hypothetical protein [Xanthomonadales bacterium]NIX14017.1 hypothetical protein [Xanthomonadales bacterium]
MYKVAEERKPPACTYTISARSKAAGVSVWTFLRRHFGQVPLDQIESMFGFVENSTLYGGRIFSGPELSERDVRQLNEAGIGIRLPLSNHLVSREEYEMNRGFLNKYHREPNSVIVTSDDLARWVRKDFPDYRIDASVIKNINNINKLEEAFELYDEVVLPMASNEDTGFLASIGEKEKITLFANAGCAFTCPSKICYPSISKKNKGDPEAQFQCSQDFKEREQLGMIDFELQPLIDMGFRSFKLLRPAPGHHTGF